MARPRAAAPHPAPARPLLCFLVLLALSGACGWQQAGPRSPLPFAPPRPHRGCVACATPLPATGGRAAPQCAAVARPWLHARAAPPLPPPPRRRRMRALRPLAPNTPCPLTGPAAGTGAALPKNAGGPTPRQAGPLRARAGLHRRRPAGLCPRGAATQPTPCPAAAGAACSPTQEEGAAPAAARRGPSHDGQSRSRLNLPAHRVLHSLAGARCG